MRPEQKYAAIASSMSWLKRIAREGRGWSSLHRRPAGADSPCPSCLGIFVVGIDSPRNELAGARKKGASRAVGRVADGVARHKFWVYRRRALLRTEKAVRSSDVPPILLL